MADHILALHGWLALAVVFALPALESSAFVGFLFPGEIAVVLGGVLAFQHRVPLAAAIAAGVAGAVVGDTIGYAVGKRFGHRMLYGTVGRFVRAHHLERAERYLAARGGRAVFFGRFTAALRVLVPGLAGMAGLEYATFAIYNVTGAAVWGTGFTMLGFLAGDSWRRVEHTARRAGVLLLVLALILLAVFLAARWVASHRDTFEGWVERQLDRPWVQSAARRYERQLAFLARRVRPGGVLGLTLTVQLALLVVFGWCFGLVLRLVGDEERARIDRPVLDLVVRHRTGWLDHANTFATAFGSKAVLIPLVLGVGGAYFGRRRRARWEPFLLLAVATAGAALSSEAIKALVHKPRPPVVFHLVGASGYGFPSGHATQAAAVYGLLSIVLARSLPRWPQKVAVVASLSVVTLLVGLSRVYLGVHWLTDVLGGWALGWAWAMVVLAADSLRRAPRPPQPPAPADARPASA